MLTGFEAYVGLIHVEKAHTHPILVTFVKMVQDAIRERREREKEHRLIHSSGSSDTSNLPDGLYNLISMGLQFGNSSSAYDPN
jgi:hypothetical protein